MLTKCCDDNRDEHTTFEDIDDSVSVKSNGNLDSTSLASLAAASGFKLDDLKIVEGIGPKIEELLHKDGILTWEELGNTPKETLASILNKAGDRFKFHDPSTWSEQAKLAAEGRFEELKEYQDFLDGGKNYK